MTRATCPVCDSLVLVTRSGFLLHHFEPDKLWKTGRNLTCAGAGLPVQTSAETPQTHPRDSAGSQKTEVR